MVLEVDDANGNALEKYQDQSTRVDAQTYIRWINYILSNPTFRQPLFQASFNKTVFPGYDVALKTGTTNDYRDAWAFGYTPALAVGVWAGNSDNAPMQHSGTSILAAVPIWSDFLNKVLPSYPQESFTPPDPLPPNTKPMLNGQYINNWSIHSILYYVDKNDPTGPTPTNPMRDPQFTNWEAGVRDWV